jgi:two-component system NtrC family sensor kinase
MRKGLRPGALVRILLASLYLASLAPFTITLLRKVESFGRVDMLVSEESSVYRVRFVGASAAPTGLRVDDVLLLVDGRDARSAGDPSERLARSSAELTIVRGGELASLRSSPAPAPWDIRYLFLFCVGATFFVAGASALRQPGGFDPSSAPLLFSGFALSVALVLVLTPVGPVDGFFRTSVLVEDIARALFPALLLELVFTFPRRARPAPTLLFFLPTAVLLVFTTQLYFGGGTGFDASRRVAALDHAQGAWMTAASLIAAVRLVVLSRRTIDLPTEKQIRFLLFGTAVGLLPVCVLNLLPRLLGGSIPVLSSLSLLPLALVPMAFLAALTRYRLWDVEVLSRETAAFIGAILIGAGFFTVAQMLLAHPLSLGIPYAKGLLQTAAGLLLALSFVPVRRGLSAAFSRLQYREAWREREGLLALVRELPAPRALSEIRHLLVTRISKGLGVSPAALLTVSEEDCLDGDAVDGGGPMPLEELPKEAQTRTTRLSRQSFAVRPTATVARLRRAGFRTLAPLTVSGRLLALFAVGDRAGRVPLSIEDTELLETVLAPAALALDHARLYEELKTQADRYRSLKEFHEDVVEGSAAAIASTDEAGRFTSVNPAFAALTGKPEVALLAARDTEILPDAVLSVGAPARVETDLGTGPRVLNVAVSPFPGATPGSRARVYVLYDATETARLEKALADRERLAALGTLSAGVAHEVNTPLAGVAGFARLLLDETPETSPHRRLVEKIEKQAFRASRLIGSLLDLARGRPREMVPLDSRDLVREAASALEDEAVARGVVLAVDVPAQAPGLLGHGDALVQALVNIIKNGIEAAAAVRREAPVKSIVSLRLRAPDGYVVFEVEDNGAGMTPEESRRIFQPFYSTKTAQGGTGLGLAIAGDIIREHGGQLAVDSEPGSGSRFTVTLPATR